MTSAEPTDRRVLMAGLLLGLGLGGFFDGILLHQILQWHNMLSSKVPPTTLVDMKYNMVFDGLFHAATWALTVAGVALLVRAGVAREEFRASAFAGAAFGGWGLFNFVEGLIDHQLLGLHHVHPGEHQLAWDLGFLASGLLLMALGFRAVRRGRRPLRHGIQRPAHA
jgi:uncharacterized membrane protein